MRHFYDYEDFIFEIHGEIYEEKITMIDSIKVVRGEPIFEDYRPITAYYLMHEDPSTDFEVSKVSDVMKELIQYNTHNK